jgi:predicted DNA-binding protein (UPF0251 family)
MTPTQVKAQLTPEIIQKIRALAAEGIEHQHLAQRFGVSRATITRIVNRAGGWQD